MPLSKKVVLGGIPVLAIGGAGVWMLMSGFWDSKDSRRGANVSLSLKKFKRSLGEGVEQLSNSLKTGAELLKEIEPEEEDDALKTEDPLDDEEEDLDTSESVVVDDPKKRIVDVGLNCGDADREKDCEILEGGLNVDVGGERRENYEFADDSDNGKIKFRISDDPIFNDKFRFIVTEKPIKLRSKTDITKTITLDRYENYALVKDEESDKVYLTRKLTAEQGKKRSLGIPDGCTLPKDISTQAPTRATCKLSTNQIKSVSFEGKKNEGATSRGEVKLYIQKVSDTNTYKGGYKFTFLPEADLNISENDKIRAKIWKDFRLKDPDADDLVLEKVWKDEGGLLSLVGLSCGADGKCTIRDGALRIKDDKKYIENGKKKEGNGIIHLENKNAAGYYEGLMFSVWGGEITIEKSTSSSGSPIKMEELGIYHIVKEERGGSSSYYLAKKAGGVDEMLKVYLGLWSCPPLAGHIRTGNGKVSDMSTYKFHDGDGEKYVTVNAKDNHGVTIVITSTKSSDYPFGYKFSIKPKKEMKIGKMTLAANVENNFKIKKDVANKKLYLVKA